MQRSVPGFGSADTPLPDNMFSYPQQQQGGPRMLSYPGMQPRPSATNSSTSPSYACSFPFGASSNSQIDLSDFPALGTGAAGQSSAPGLGGSYSGTAASLRAPPGSFSQDDFPALNGGRNGDDLFMAAEQASAAAALQHQHQQREQHRLGGDQPISSARDRFGEPERNYATKLGLPPFGAAGQPNGASSPKSEEANSNPPGLMAQTPAQQILTSPADRFGLLGLLSIIKMQDLDLSMLTIGSDLQTLGLNLNASDSLYSSFITPWTDNNIMASMQVEPDFTLPSCYNVQPPPPAQSKIASFSDETLFFVFYSRPRDVLQEVAAQELYSRNWRYHKELHVWLTKEQNTEPTHKTPTYERGTYVFFDHGSWEKVSKNFILMYEMLEDRPPQIAVQAA